MTTRLYLEFDASCKSIPLSREDAHYLVRVLRLKAGDVIHVFNETVGEWRCVLADVTKMDGMLYMQDCVRPPHNEPATYLVYAPLKHDAMAFLFEKATELGVTHFQPMITDHAQKYAMHADKVLRQLKQAVQQCERLSVPKVLPALRFDQIVAHYPDAYIALERCDAMPFIRALPTDTGLPCVFIVGAEGGFSPREVDFACKSTLVPVSLGRTILRAETAALVGLGAIHMARSC